MQFMLGEVAPAAPALLEPLLALLFFAIALGLITLVSYLTNLLVQVLQRTIGKLPGIGGAISGAAADIGQAITSTLGRAVTAIDHDISFWWHALSAEIDWMGREIANTAGAVAAVASLVSGSPNARAQAWIKSAIHLALKGVSWLAHEALHGVKALEKKIEHAESGLIATAIRAALQPVTSELTTLENWAYPKVKALEDELAGVVEPDIAALRKRATALENDAIQVYRDASGVFHAVNVDALVAAVAIALPKLGLDWLRCNTASSVAGKRGCGLWSGLDDILGLLADVVLIGSICEVLPLLQTAVDDVGKGLVEGIHAAGLTACAGSYPQPPPMPALTLSLPHVYGVS